METELLNFFSSLRPKKFRKNIFEGLTHQSVLGGEVYLNSSI